MRAGKASTKDDPRAGGGMMQAQGKEGRLKSPEHQTEDGGRWYKARELDTRLGTPRGHQVG
jgi:hypothetical protein